MQAIPEPQALILVDLQRAFVEGEKSVPNGAAVMDAARQQLQAARSERALVVHVQNHGSPGSLDEPGTPGWELAIVPGDEEGVIGKMNDSAFDGTKLHDVLNSHGVTGLSVSGLLSEMCVAATVRSALDLGYDVVLAHDSHATYPVPGLGAEPEVPAALAARAAEWSLGDTVHIPATSAEVRFRAARPA